MKFKFFSICLKNNNNFYATTLLSIPTITMKNNNDNNKSKYLVFNLVKTFEQQ